MSSGFFVLSVLKTPPKQLQNKPFNKLPQGKTNKKTAAETAAEKHFFIFLVTRVTYTNSMIAISAASPRRGPVFTIRQ